MGFNGRLIIEDIKINSEASQRENEIEELGVCFRADFEDLKAILAYLQENQENIDLKLIKESLKHHDKEIKAAENSVTSALYAFKAYLHRFKNEDS